MVYTYQDEQSLQDALNTLVLTNPVIVCRGVLFSIIDNA